MQIGRQLNQLDDATWKLRLCCRLRLQLLPAYALQLPQQRLLLDQHCARTEIDIEVLAMRRSGKGGARWQMGDEHGAVQTPLQVVLVKKTNEARGLLCGWRGRYEELFGGHGGEHEQLAADGAARNAKP